MKTATNIVNRIEDNTDPREVLCTTYQMRNPFRQFYDGVASELDSHCYYQHAYAADLCPKGGRVLDVCSGRGLLIPFLRYRGKKPSVYVGVDIKPTNAVWRLGKDPRRPTEQKEWGFPLMFVESNVAEMSGPVRNAAGDLPFDLIVFTSSIEHMQPEAQRDTLVNCAKLSKPGTTLYLTCPVTESGRSGYETQFRAHVYEPTENELKDWLDAAGFAIHRRIGLCTTVTRFRAALTGSALLGANYLYEIMPRQQALPTIAAMYPQCATEIGYLCHKR